MRESKWSAPVAMTMPTVSRLPIHSAIVSGPSDPIGRYNRTRFSTPTAAARIAKCTPFSEGQRYPAYCERPMYPDAISSGPLNTNCQMKRNPASRPHRSRP